MYVISLLLELSLWLKKFYIYCRFHKVYAFFCFVVRQIGTHCVVLTNLQTPHFLCFPDVETAGVSQYA